MMPIPIFLMDVEHKVVVELLEVHSFVVKICCYDVVVHIFDANIVDNISFPSLS